MTPANDPHALLYTQLDPEEAKALTTRLLGACDDGELYLQFMASESFAFDDGRLKTADYSRDSGFGLRGVSGETTGFAHANEISATAIARAGETLQLLDATTSLHSAPP
ncbi:MAG: DNA gyrase modulator, partial [Pseudomonadota bacterium]|nr:DNA gyrase modulator [Pseudomonadota bacterium]